MTSTFKLQNRPALSSKDSNLQYVQHISNHLKVSSKYEHSSLETHHSTSPQRF